jgi:hypothetical protein
MPLRRLLAGYELAASVSGCFLLWRIAHAGSDWGTLTVGAAVLGFSLIAGLGGVLLWGDRPTGYRLCQVGEWLRLVRFATPWVSYYSFLGLDLNIGVQVYTHGIPGVGADATGTAIWLQWNAVGIIQFAVLQPPPFLAIGLNLVGLLALIGLGTLIRRHRQSRGEPPVPADVSAVAV